MMVGQTLFAKEKTGIYRYTNVERFGVRSKPLLSDSSRIANQSKLFNADF